MIIGEQNEVNNEVNNYLHTVFWIGEIGYLCFDADVSVLHR